MLHGLREYRGEPHRVEHVAVIDGVDFYDDSKGTNVGATVAAISGLGADRAPAKLVLILGGDGKGQDFSPLRDGVMRHARAVALIGRDGPQIRRGPGRQRRADAVARHAGSRHRMVPGPGLAQAHSGDSVLLSRPAPAWTCSATMVTARRSSWKPSNRWRATGGCRHERGGLEELRRSPQGAGRPWRRQEQRRRAGARLGLHLGRPAHADPGL